MIYLTVCLNVLDALDYDEAYQAAKKVEALTIKEDGCIYFHVYPASREKRQIMMWEIWKDKVAIEANHEQPYSKAFSANQFVRPGFGYESNVEG